MTLREIHIRLLLQRVPSAIQNFVGHFRSDMSKAWSSTMSSEFIIQTRSPLGDGTSSESIWGKEFEDKFSDNLKQ
jgi:peptidylprolyl isomerase domain and WD repeat-containing protein 1